MSRNPNSWKDGQKWEFYPQRMRYPSSPENADPEGYKQAVELLGGSDNIITPYGGPDVNALT